MKIKILFFLFCIQYGFSQINNTIYTTTESEKPIKKEVTFTQFEVSIPLQGNKNRGDYLPDGSKNDDWFIPDGVNANFGYGIHRNKWLGITANTGIGTKLSEKLVVVPVFGNLRIMPLINENSRLGVDIGLGKSFALGRGNLTGTFKRAKLIMESDHEEMQLFLEVLTYGFSKEYNGPEMTSISLGFTILTFN